MRDLYPERGQTFRGGKMNIWRPEYQVELAAYILIGMTKDVFYSDE